MIKFNDIKVGDIVIAEYEGQHWEGVVTELNKEDKEVCVKTPIQQFWFTEKHLFPVPLSDESLGRLGFEKEVNEDGSAKYLRGPFRIQVPDSGDFHPLQIWYREDHRLLANPIYVHELQNHYFDMTKVELNAI